MMAANAQSANGSQQNTGNKQSTGAAQTNGATGQRKSGQVVSQDYNKVPASMPNELATLAPHLNQNVAQGSGGNAGEKIKVRQEFGPQQASKRNDAPAQPASGGNGGKPKTDTKTQSPK